MPDDDVLDEMILDEDLNLEEVAKIWIFMEFLVTFSGGELLSDRSEVTSEGLKTIIGLELSLKTHTVSNVLFVHVHVHYV